MNRTTSIAFVGLAFLATLVLGSFLALQDRDDLRRIARLDPAQLDHARGLDQTKVIISSYSCDGSMANWTNAQNPNLPPTVGADGCPNNLGANPPICINCDAPGTDFTLVLNTLPNGLRIRPGYYPNASVSCGPLTVGACAVGANGTPSCNNLKPIMPNLTCNDVTEFFVQPPVVANPD